MSLDTAFLLLIFVAALAQALFSVASARGMVEVAGWRTLRPGGIQWVALGLCVGIAALCLYLWLFVGSARADAERQMVYLFWSSMAFSALAVLVGVQMMATIRRAVSWRDGTIAFRTRGIDCHRDIAEIARITQTALGVRITFADGATLGLDPHVTGAQNFSSMSRGIFGTGLIC